MLCTDALSDDSERAFLLEYVEKHILPSNPFQTLDEEGVGRLIAMATKEGRAARPDLSVGTCIDLLNTLCC